MDQNVLEVLDLMPMILQLIAICIKLYKENKMSILNTYLQDLQEASRKQRSRATISRKTKIKRSQGQLSTAMARKRGDPQYKMMKKYCDLCKKYREKVHKKYAARNRSKARK